MAAYARAIEIAQRTAAHPQHEPADIRLLGLALVSVGNQQLAQGESATAVIRLEAAVENFRGFAKAASFAEGQRSIAYALQYLGQAYGGHGDIELAAQTYRQAIAVREEIAHRDPKNIAPRRELSIAYSLLGDEPSPPSSSLPANGARPCLFIARHSRSVKKRLPRTAAMPGPSAI